MSARFSRLVGLYATVAAAAALVFAPLLALSYFAIDEGVEQLESATVSAWAEPGRDLAGGLVTFASADRVYATYTQVFALLFPAVLLCAWATRGRGGPHARLERWGWRIALAGYALLAFGLLLISIMLIGASASSPILNVAFLPFMLPGVVLGTIGSTVLGIALLRAGYEPRATAWLLAFAVPLWLAGNIVLGHNSLGMVPVFLAWGVTGWRLWRADRIGMQRPHPAATT
ncbi:MAG: hypothetical protein ABR521_01625 [Gaiellaceae bacterium]